MKIGPHVQFNKGNSKSKLQKISLGERAYDVQRMKLSSVTAISWPVGVSAINL